MGCILDNVARAKEAIMPPQVIYIEPHELRNYRKETGNYGPITYEQLKK